jgi:hypothetical protein
LSHCRGELTKPISDLFTPKETIFYILYFTFFNIN